MASASHLLALCVFGVACCKASLNEKGLWFIDFGNCIMDCVPINDLDLPACISGWTDAINLSLRRCLEYFNAKDWDAVVTWYTADARVLKPGQNIIVGRDAIDASFRADDSARHHHFVVQNLRVTSLRYYCESWAVAEVGYFDLDKGKVGVGVMVFKMEDAVPKIATDIFYEL